MIALTATPLTRVRTIARAAFGSAFMMTAVLSSWSQGPATIPPTQVSGKEAVPAAKKPASPEYLFELGQKSSLIRVGVVPSDITEKNRAAAQKVWDAILKKDIKLAAEAVTAYEELIPVDNFGGDYTALQWLCEDFIATQKGEKREYNLYEKGFKEYLAANDYDLLKTYLVVKYGMGDFDMMTLKVPVGADGKPVISAKIDPENVSAFKDLRRQLEDFIMFMNPRRDTWESSAAVMNLLNLKPGEKVADIGCGIGFFSLKMAEAVGPTGKVFAIDTDESYTKRTMEFAVQAKLTNIVPVPSEPRDIKVTEPFDVAFIASLYHVIYGWSPEVDRKAFLESILKSLKPDGRLVIVDNLDYNGQQLHSCFVDHRLVAAQFYHYGLDVDVYAEVSPLRYVLILKKRQGETPPVQSRVELAKTDPNNTDLIRVTSGNSIVHIGSLDSFDITEGGISAAKMALLALEGKDRQAAFDAIKMYENLIPNENFGGEFTAIQWFLEHMVAPPKVKEEMLSDALTKAYYHYLADDDYDLLIDYIKNKYKLLKPGERTKLVDDPPERPRPAQEEGKEGAPAPGATPPPGQGAPVDARSQVIRPETQATDATVGKTQRTFLEDFILFNNPRRPQWENTPKIMELMDIKPGMKIADVGCGSGYFTFRFSKLVGPEGKVFSMDIKKPHLDFINEFKQKQGITNVETVMARNEDIMLNTPCDIAYMCSLYHIFYGVAPEGGRRELLASIKKAIKPGGLLVIVDNGPVADETLPYHGPYLAKELTIAQLERFGFKLESSDQIIPQRYMLKFRHVIP